MHHRGKEDKRHGYELVVRKREMKCNEGPIQQTVRVL